MGAADRCSRIWRWRASVDPLVRERYGVGGAEPWRPRVRLGA